MLHYSRTRSHLEVGNKFAVSHKQFDMNSPSRDFAVAKQLYVILY
jgi:hypothetical protein